MAQICDVIILSKSCGKQHMKIILASMNQLGSTTSSVMVMITTFNIKVDLTSIKDFTLKIVITTVTPQAVNQCYYTECASGGKVINYCLVKMEIGLSL